MTKFKKLIADKELNEAHERIAELERHWHREEANANRLSRELEQAEAELAKRPFYPKSQTQYFEVVQRAEKAEATIERLKVCGSCDELGGDYGDECCRSWLGPVDPYHAYRPAENVEPHEHCHFTPSRWAERGGE
jgi:TolA-binding protein